MAKFKALPFLLLVASSIVHSSIVDSKQMPEGDKIHVIVRRQANLRRQEDARSESRATAVSVSSSATSGGGSRASPSSTKVEEADAPNQLVGGTNVSDGRAKVRPQQPAGPVNAVGGDEDDIPVVRPNRRRRPTQARRPPAAARPHDSDDRRRYDAEDEDCDDYGGNDYEYGPNLFNMATRPMRQFSNMMNNVFDRMQGLASGGGKSVDSFMIE